MFGRKRQCAVTSPLWLARAIATREHFDFSEQEIDIQGEHLSTRIEYLHCELAFIVK